MHIEIDITPLKQWVEAGRSITRPYNSRTGYKILGLTTAEHRTVATLASHASLRKDLCAKLCEANPVVFSSGIAFDLLKREIREFLGTN